MTEKNANLNTEKRGQVDYRINTDKFLAYFTIPTVWIEKPFLYIYKSDGI